MTCQVRQHTSIFDLSRVDALDADAAAAMVGATQGALREQEGWELVLAAQRAVLHGPESNFGRGWRMRQPSPGVYLWRTPHGYWFRVDDDGTHPLGRDPDLSDPVMRDRALLRPGVS